MKIAIASPDSEVVRPGAHVGFGRVWIIIVA
jgi:hypothetical protein